MQSQLNNYFILTMTLNLGVKSQNAVIQIIKSNFAVVQMLSILIYVVIRNQYKSSLFKHSHSPNRVEHSAHFDLQQLPLIFCCIQWIA